MPLKDREKRRLYEKEYKQGEKYKEYSRSAHRRRYLQEQDQQRRRKVAGSKRATKTQKKHDAETQGGRSHQKKWTEQEIELIWDTSFTTRDLAELLGRTYSAVRSARSRNAAKRPGNYRHNGNRKAVFPDAISEEVVT